MIRIEICLVLPLAAWVTLRDSHEGVSSVSAGIEPFVERRSLSRRVCRRCFEVIRPVAKKKKSPPWGPAEWIAGRSQERSRPGSYRAFFHGLRGRCLCPWGDPLGPSLLCSWAYQIFVRKSGLMRDIVKHDESLARMGGQRGLFMRFHEPMKVRAESSSRSFGPA